MGPQTIWRQILNWLAFLPIRLAFRIIWIMALISPDARAVHRAMWDVNLAVPPIQKKEPRP